MTGRIVSEALNEALDLVYPDALYCICCGKIIDGTRPYRMCNECMREMKWVAERTCRKCGRVLSDNNIRDTCYSCFESDHVFDNGYTCAEYDMHARTLIQSMKFHGRTDIARTIAEIMSDRLELLRYQGCDMHYDLLVPVPMYERKRLRRGFNQAELIARHLAKRMDVPCANGLIVRIRDTSAMKGLSPDERKQNISGAFRVNSESFHYEKLSGSRVLIIDDIYTLGNTADEVARTLRRAGAVRIDVMTFAAGADMIMEPTEQVAR